jgi:hypothetical protein
MQQSSALHQIFSIPDQMYNKQYQLILFLSQVEELELSKIKATDLLKAHDGDAGKALRAYIAPVA